MDFVRLYLLPSHPQFISCGLKHVGACHHATKYIFKKESIQSPIDVISIP